jgi:hypothetical protein
VVRAGRLTLWSIVAITALGAVTAKVKRHGLMNLWATCSDIIDNVKETTAQVEMANARAQAAHAAAQQKSAMERAKLHVLDMFARA